MKICETLQLYLNDFAYFDSILHIISKTGDFQKKELIKVKILCPTFAFSFFIIFLSELGQDKTLA